LKGLPPRDADIAIEEPPTWLAIHEFDTEDVDMKALMATTYTEWSKRILGGAKKRETPAYRFVKSYGDGKFFQ
jgi:hypothetical protein